MKGSFLTETIFSLLIISILLVFTFESAATSLNQTNKIEFESERISLLNFVYGYLSKYELKHDISNITPEHINTAYWNGTPQYPKVLSLNAQIVEKTVSGKQIKYRRVDLQIERNPGKITNHILIFGM
ncbi:hypothetical protein ACSFC1_03330 [Pseudothermotoga sp. U03pept]|uniref:hypothetical protein n=1 Tax=Pseudothermotoga sp. U03pept TaxID=3447012 RepID=UPI003F00D889